MKKIKELFEKYSASDRFWMPFVFIVTVAAFLPAVSFKELISDDVFYHLNILSLQNSISRIFEPVLGLRTPLTSLSLYADMLLWGKEHFVSGSHFTNILLHALNGVLFFCLLRKLQWNGKTLSPAWAGITVLIFALHPQRVESVAWLCERKDTLSMALGLAALLLFLRDMRKDKVSWQSGIFLVLSFLAKPMWMFFFVPAAALIWIEHKKFQWRFYLKHLVVPVGIFLVYLLCHLPGILSNAAHSEIAAASLPLKIETVLYNYGNYFLRTFLPGNLFPLYPYYNPATDPRWMTLIPVVLLFTPLLARKKELRDAVIFGVLPVLVCFAVILIPVVGFIRVGNTDFADRYSYLPSLFLLAGAAFLLKLNIPKESAFGLWLPAMGILYCGGLLYKTELYLPVWKNPQSVTARSIALKTPNFSAVISTAHNRYLEKNFDGAIEICKEKLLEMPHYPPNFNRLIQIFKLALQGLILFQHNKPDEGIRYLNTIYMLPYSHLAFSLPVDFAQKIFTTGAEYHLKKYNDRAAAANLYRRCAVFFKLRSPLYTAFYSGMAALVEKNYAEAVKFFRIACELNPGEKRCQRNLKYALKALKEQKK